MKQSMCQMTSLAGGVGKSIEGLLEDHAPLKRVTRRALDCVVAPMQRLEEIVTPGACVLSLRRHLQVDRYSCGAAAAFMILEYYNKVCTFERVARALGTDRNGTDEWNLTRLFKRNGLEVGSVYSIKAICRAIAEYNAPVLLPVIGDHWSVAYGYSDGYIFVADPALTKTRSCRVTREEFRRRYWSSHWGVMVYRRPTARRRVPRREPRKL